MKLNTIFSKTKNPFPNSKHIIKFAFECDGVKYYEFDTTANLPFRRGLKFISIYNEIDMKVDKYYLTQHIDAMEKLLKGKINLESLSKMLQLNNQLKERQQFVVQEDLVFKIASVVFFDESENPDDWEWKYASEKIAKWKKTKIGDFFLHEPIQRLMPFLNVSKENLETYSQVEKLVDEGHLGNILDILSPGQKKNFPLFTDRFFAQEMKVISPA